MFAQVFSAIVVILAFTAGSLLIQWLGEQIDVKGIGNGISILIFAGIVSRWTSIFTTIKTWLGFAAGSEVKYYFLIPVFVVLNAISVIVFIVILNAAERPHPGSVRKARCWPQDGTVGRARTSPSKVNMSGVMPVIFANARPPSRDYRRVLPEPVQCDGHPFAAPFLQMFSTNGWVYAAIYLLLIICVQLFLCGDAV